MSTTTKKASAKANTTKSTGASAKHASTHPPWVDMIKECIISHPDDARSGVSRPTIKKFVESQYRVEINAAAASQLNRAITHGAEKGVFLLPKGPSGKVKIAPKSRSDAAKENATPVVKKAAAPKAKPAPAKPAPLKKAIVTRPASKSAPSIAKSTRTSTSKAKASAQKKNSTVAKRPQTKKASVTTKKLASTKKPAAGKKTTTVKKGAAKKTVTGTVEKPKKVTVKPKSKGTATKGKSGTATPAIKAKPTSKTTTTKRSVTKKA